MQAARGLIGAGIEFAAGVQRRHDDFERGFLREFRMRIDRNAAAIVGDGEIAVGLELDLDEGRVAGDRLVHGIVEHFGEEVVQAGLVGAADIHAGAPAHRLQPLQHLDRLFIVAGGFFLLCGLSRRAFGGRVFAGRAAKKIVLLSHRRILRRFGPKMRRPSLPTPTGGGRERTLVSSYASRG